MWPLFVVIATQISGNEMTESRERATSAPANGPAVLGSSVQQQKPVRVEIRNPTRHSSN
jgi:hypothetical protein